MGYAMAEVDLQSKPFPKIDASLRWTVWDGVGQGYSEDPNVKSHMVQENDEARDDGNEANDGACDSGSDSGCASSSSSEGERKRRRRKEELQSTNNIGES